MLKLNKIQIALDLQDEKDKVNTFLMGGTNLKQTQTRSDSVDGPKIEKRLKTIDVRKSQRFTSNGVLDQADEPKEKRNPVIGLESNCYTCSKTENNREVLKAFKMACLSYKPAKVEFNKLFYSRGELIESKQLLVDNCLAQLRHLNIDDSIDKVIVEKS